jgi:glycosyltransferase involved in cell wall biosynthesis
MRAPAAAMPPPQVSVVVPAHDAAAYLGECLDSVAAQRGVALEVIVVDDGSRDATAALAQARAGVRCLRQPQRGPAAARNAGIAAARAPLVAFLDADDLWPPAALASALAVLQREPEAALVFGDCRQFDAGGPHPRTLFEDGGFGAAAWGKGTRVPQAHARLLEANFITTGAVVARRAVLQALGGFDEGLRLVEDLDLWLRVAHAHPLAWHPQLALLRRRHAANVSRDADAMSLAWLEVLERERRRHAPLAPALAAALARQRAGERLQLAQRALARGDAAQAAAQARRALADGAGWRAAAAIVQAGLLRLGGRR